jgi:hypothetical protein
MYDVFATTMLVYLIVGFAISILVNIKLVMRWRAGIYDDLRSCRKTRGFVVFWVMIYLIGTVLWAPVLMVFKGR